MRYIRQFVIILTISFLGEVIKSFIPLPIPASIYGLVLMFGALCTGIVKLESVKDTAKFLIEIMPLMFIPAAVGLTQSWGIIRPALIPIVVITLVSTIVVMAVSGMVTQYVIRRIRKK